MKLPAALERLSKLGEELGIKGFTIDLESYEICDIFLKGNSISIDMTRLIWTDSQGNKLLIRELPTKRLMNIINFLEKDTSLERKAYYSITYANWIAILRMEMRSRSIKQEYDRAVYDYEKSQAALKTAKDTLAKVSPWSHALRMQLDLDIQKADVESSMMKSQIDSLYKI